MVANVSINGRQNRRLMRAVCDSCDSSKCSLISLLRFYLYIIYILYIDKQKWIKYFIVTTVTTTAVGIG